jgi:hypothetical protein
VGSFRFPGRRRDFRDSGDGKADRLAGPRRVAQGCGRGAVPAGSAARASGRERERKQRLGFEW